MYREAIGFWSAQVNKSGEYQYIHPMCWLIKHARCVLKMDYTTNAFTFMHQIKSGINFF